MYSQQVERERNARLMNGVMNLGGRNASSLEVDLALGLAPPTLSASRLGAWLRTFVAKGPFARKTHAAPPRPIGTSDYA
jgi:hypothetical protein